MQKLLFLEKYRCVPKIGCPESENQKCIDFNVFTKSLKEVIKCKVAISRKVAFYDFFYRVHEKLKKSHKVKSALFFQSKIFCSHENSEDSARTREIAKCACDSGPAGDAGRFTLCVCFCVPTL